MDLVCRNLSFDFVLFRIRPLKLLEFACLRHMTTHILHGCIDGYLILYMYNVDCVYAYICASLKIYGNCCHIGIARYTPHYQFYVGIYVNVISIYCALRSI